MSKIIFAFSVLCVAVCASVNVSYGIQQPQVYGQDSFFKDRPIDIRYAELVSSKDVSLPYIIESLYGVCKQEWSVDSGFYSCIQADLEEVYAKRMQVSDDSSVFALLVRNILMLSGRGRQALCIELINNILPYYQQKQQTNYTQMTNYLCRLYIMLGAAYEEVGFWRQALNIYRQAMALVDDEGFIKAEPIRTKKFKAMLYNNMGTIYLKRNDYQRASGFYSQAIDINKELNSGKELFNNYNNMAEVEIMQNNLPRALEYAFLAQQQTSLKDNSYDYYFIQCNISQIYLMQGKLEIAWEYMSDGLNYMRDNGYDMDYGYGCLFAARLWREKKDHAKARFYLQEAERVAKQMENQSLTVRVYDQFSDYYHDNGNTEEAFAYLKKSSMLNDSIRLMDDVKRLSDMELVYEVEKVLQENSLLSKEAELKDLQLRRQLLIIIMTIVLCVIVLCVAVWWILNLRKRRKVEQKLAEHEAWLKDRELKTMQQRQNDLSNELEIKNRELTSKVLKLLKNNEFVIHLTEELKQLLAELNPRDNVKKEHIREMMMQLRLQSNNNSDTEFKYYFEQVYNSFYENLLKAYPSLTSRDLRLCAFLRIGLSTKEIAVITFREIRSVESSRNRLRKKMNLPADTNLTEFFSRF